MKKQSLQTNENYNEWISELKKRYRATQIKAALAVNSSMIEFYFNLGKDICIKYDEFTRSDIYGKNFFNQVMI